MPFSCRPVSPATRPGCRAGLVALAFLAALAAFAARPGPATAGGLPGPEAADWRVCATAARLVESFRPELPGHLMGAIAKAETGRRPAGQSARRAWPWTINAAGEGRYFPTKSAAIRAVRRYRARGVESIDVGCMQVNLYYHGDAFDSLDQAFDPAHNVAYAAEFLLGLQREAGSWIRAVRRYHSRNLRDGAPYRQKVYRIWRADRQRARDLAAARRQARNDSG